MGVPFVKILRRHGLRVAILDLQHAVPGNGARHPRGVPVYRIPVSPRGRTNLEGAGLRLADYSVVVMAVPIPQFDAAMRVVGPGLARGSLVMDIASTKALPLRSMLAHTRPGVAVLGTHPLFGPRLVPRMAGWNVVLVATARCRRRSAWYEWTRRFFGRQGATITECPSAAEHDAKVAITQLATHFFYLSFARFLSTASSVNDLSHYATPPYRALLAGAVRLLNSAPLAATIQSLPPEGRRIRKACRVAMNEVDRMLARRDPARAAAELQVLRRRLGPAVENAARPPRTRRRSPR
jgi:prephenate dehydrogenase